MASHIAQDVLKGTAPNSPRATEGIYQPRKSTRPELAEEYTRNLLPHVRSRLIVRDSEGRNVL